MNKERICVLFSDDCPTEHDCKGNGVCAVPQSPCQGSVLTSLHIMIIFNQLHLCSFIQEFLLLLMYYVTFNALCLQVSVYYEHRSCSPKTRNYTKSMFCLINLVSLTKWVRIRILSSPTGTD